MGTAQDYKIGWICALEIEYAAACDVLDEQYESNGPADGNLYTFGRIHDHKIVIACLPKGRYGITSAAIVAERLRSSFSNLWFCLMVGIAGGAPTAVQDIRLGDVVVSSPGPRHGGVIQYDFGKTIQNQDFEQTGHLAPPPEILLNAMAHLNTQHKKRGHRIKDTVDKMTENGAEYRRPSSDNLCLSSYVHSGDCDCQDSTTNGSHLVRRQPRAAGVETLVHYGLIASANSLLKDATVRDALAQKYQVLCFEMEGASIMNILPSLVVRGICDYSDTHKNKNWQGYAAGTAAAYVKELLEVVPGKHVQQGSRFVVPFSLDGTPVAKKFIGRPEQILKLSKVLLPQEQRQLFVLSGLGGIGKTQLAVEFCRLCSSKFTAILWLDGSSKDTLNQSIAHYAHRIPADETWDPNIVKHLDNNLDAIARAVIRWLEQKENKNWLVVFDNVDREHVALDPLSYDIQHFMPQADHGSVLITTRLIQLGQLGELLELEKVDIATAKELLNSWYTKPYGEEEANRLLEHLDGLPLAIAQAGAFLLESGIDMSTYIRLYEDRREEVAESLQGLELHEYPNRSAWTTWLISYEAVHSRDKHAAHLLVFWSFLARSNVWFGLFEKALRNDAVAARLKSWLGSIPSQEIVFIKAMRLLRSYCLTEGSQTAEGYSMHPVLHRWTYLKKGLSHKAEIGTLALEVVGLAVSWKEERQTPLLRSRIFPHAQTCLKRTLANATKDGREETLPEQTLKEETGIRAIHSLGILFCNQGKLQEGEKLFQMALTGYERFCGADDESTLRVVASMANVYTWQERFDKANQFLSRVLHSKTNISIKFSLQVSSLLSVIYMRQGNLQKAEQTQKTLLHTYEAIYGPKAPFTLTSANNLAGVYKQQCRFVEAEEMYDRVLRDREEAFGPLHSWTLETVYNIGQLRLAQEKYKEAEHQYLRAYQGYEKVVGPDHPSTLFALIGLGYVYHKQGRLAEAENLYLNALKGYELLDPMVETYPPALTTMFCLGQLYIFKFGKVEEGKALLKRALAGYNITVGESSKVCISMRGTLDNSEGNDNTALAETSHIE